MNKKSSDISKEAETNTTEDNSKTILIVDDVSEVVELIVECLCDSGYNIITANSGNEAIDLYRAEEPDLVISDIVMPDLDGLSMIKKLQKEYPLLKAMLMTGYPAIAREALGAQLNELGVVCMMEKPLNILELITTVHVLLLDENDRKSAEASRQDSTAAKTGHEMHLA